MKRKLMLVKPDEEKAEQQRVNAKPKTTRAAHKTYDAYLEQLVQKIKSILVAKISATKSCIVL